MKLLRTIRLDAYAFPEVVGEDDEQAAESDLVGPANGGRK